MKERVQPGLLARGPRLLRARARRRQAAGRRAGVQHGPLPVDRHHRRGQGRRRSPSTSCPPRCSAAGASARWRRRWRAYNPLSYHNGSVWPHDNAIIAAGLVRYGFVDEAHRIIDAPCSTSRRSPTAGCPSCSPASLADELSAPAVYPTSCIPQAWAAAAPLLFMRTLLRLRPVDAPTHAVGRAATPAAMKRLNVSRIPLDGRRVSIGIRGRDRRGQRDGGRPRVDHRAPSCHQRTLRAGPVTPVRWSAAGDRAQNPLWAYWSMALSMSRWAPAMASSGDSFFSNRLVRASTRATRVS